MKYLNIGDTLRFFRTKLKLSQKEMTPEFIDASAYSRIESNSRSIKIDELQSIFKKTGINSNEFFRFFDLDDEQTNFKELYFYCGSHLENNSKKKKLLDYYEKLKNTEHKNAAQLSNYVAIKNYFASRWEEVEEISQAEADDIFNDLMNRSFYLQHDYILISNIVRLFSAKQIDLIVPRIIPIPFEKDRNIDTKRYAYNTLINIISLKLYAMDHDGAAKYIKLAKKQNKLETDYNFKLNLQYLNNLLQYLTTGEMVYIERVHDFIHILEDIGEDMHAEQVKKEVKILTLDKDSVKMMSSYDVGLFKKN
ncbi:helix-turn-helix transcriptional regulator [Enterococcus ureilyticus]|uniref:helix-turn-helix domain-containing protein n=1 Tax=Enterococcus ureilyticus TaxID=1131292 RepID=UPI0030F59C02